MADLSSALPATANVRPTQEEPAKTCDLCGLPLGLVPHTETVGEKGLHFCCPGCRQVFLLLSSQNGALPEAFRETDLYRACVETGIISQPETGKQPLGAHRPNTEIPSLHLTFALTGMWCPSCAWLIDEVLRRTPGIARARASFLSDVLEVEYLPTLLSPDEISAKISMLGYRASDVTDKGAAEREKRDLLIRLGVSAILCCNIMMISFALYLGMFHRLSSASIAYFSYPALAMTVPVVFYGGFPILRRAFEGMRRGIVSMDTLIALGSVMAFSYSLIQVIRGSIHLYLDTAAMLITLVLFGRYVEARAREKVSSAVTQLYGLVGRKVRLATNGRERWVSADSVSAGSRFVVDEGERVPLDGEILFGTASLDESILTGEPLRQEKGPGEEVMAGSLLKQGRLVLKVIRTGKETVLGRIISLTEEALGRKDPVEVLADRVTRLFVPVVIGIAAVCALWLWLGHAPAEQILLRPLTVLLISCPCALGIAIPLAKVALLGAARARGILVADPEALEGMSRIDTVIFDKTGTLTEGRFCLRQVITTGEDEGTVLGALASVEGYSNHFLAREIKRAASEKGLHIGHVEDFEAIQGRGVRGRVEGIDVVIGNPIFMEEAQAPIPDMLRGQAANWEERGMTTAFFGRHGKAQGFLVFGDPIRDEARPLIEKLQSRGISVAIVSGDSTETTRAVAASLGVSRYVGQALPEDKVTFVRSLQQEGHAVAMVGDGVNDAPALAQSDVGCAIGPVAQISPAVSGLTLLGADPTKLMTAFDLSIVARRTIRQNLFFAFAYNAVAIPVAVAGFLNPLIAVVAMFLSSLTVIGNSLRVSSKK